MYKLITFRYNGKPDVVEGNYIQSLSLHIGTNDDKLSQWFEHDVVIPMDQEIGNLLWVATEIQRQAEQYVTDNFNS